MAFFIYDLTVNRPKHAHKCFVILENDRPNHSCFLKP